MEKFVKMERRFNTDLAIEFDKNNTKFFCEEFIEENFDCCSVIRQSIINNQTGEKNRFITVYFDKKALFDKYVNRFIAETVVNELCDILTVLKSKDIKELSYLVVGLGNVELTADAIGPLAVRRIGVTRHMSCSDKILPAVSAIAPNVLSKTGIEAVDVIKSIADRIEADILIVIDSLAAKSCDRLGCTLQITNCGISPGSGIGNLRRSIDEKSIGCPVISIGLPTVVDSATLVLDTLEMAGIDDVSDDLLKVLKESKSFFVAPKESDEITKYASELIAESLNILFGVDS